MDRNGEESKKSEEKIKFLYKNLEHISRSYFYAEGIFPFWESVYALIVGQLLVAYFTSNGNEPKIILISAGIVFSIIWFFVVSIGWHNSEYRANTMKYLQWRLIKEHERLNISTCKFYPESPINDKYLCENIIEWKLNSFWSMFHKLYPTRKALRSSWFYRRLIPLFLLLLWLWLLAVSCGWI